MDTTEKLERLKASPNNSRVSRSFVDEALRENLHFLADHPYDLLMPPYFMMERLQLYIGANLDNDPDNPELYVIKKQ